MFNKTKILELGYNFYTHLMQHLVHQGLIQEVYELQHSLLVSTPLLVPWLHFCEGEISACFIKKVLSRLNIYEKENKKGSTLVLDHLLNLQLT